MTDTEIQAGMEKIIFDARLTIDGKGITVPVTSDGAIFGFTTPAGKIECHLHPVTKILEPTALEYAMYRLRKWWRG